MPVTTHELGDQILSSCDVSGFLNYFMKNWHNCRDMWCSYLRDNVESIGVNTNNRLEATWKHVKSRICRSDHLDETLVQVGKYQQTIENEYRLNAFPIAVTVNNDYDEALADFATLVTDYAAELVYPEYKFACRAVYQFEFIDDKYLVQSLQEGCGRRVYEVEKRSWVCSCMFMSTTLLPCRHVLFIRRQEHPDCVFPPSRRIAKRWLLRYAIDRQAEPQAEEMENCSNFEIREALPRFGGPRILERPERYAIAHELTDRIASVTADLTTKDFTRVIAALEKVRDLIAQSAVDDLASVTRDTPMSPSEHPGTPPEHPVTPGEHPVTPSERDDLFSSDSYEGEDSHGDDDSRESVQLAQEYRSNGDTDTADDDEGVVSDRGDDDDYDGSDGSRSECQQDPTPFTIAVSSKGLTATRQSMKRARKARRYAATRDAIDLLHNGVSFATFFFVEHDPEATVKRVIEATTMLKVDPILNDGKVGKPKALRVTTKGIKVLGNTQIFYVLPASTVAKAQASLVKFQNAHPGIAEKEIVVQIPEKGIYFASTLESMRRWHGCMVFVKTAKAAFRWFYDVSGYDLEEEWLMAQTPGFVQAHLEALKYSSFKVDLFDWYGAKKVSKAALDVVIEALFGGEDGDTVVRICAVEEHDSRRVRNREEKRKGADRLEERDTLLGVDDICEWIEEEEQRGARWIVFPVFFLSIAHWSVVCADKGTKTLHVFDPSNGKKDELTTMVKHDFTRIISPAFRTRYSQPFVQTDNYNSGVFVVMFLEHIIHKRVFPDVDRNVLQFLRYRYISLGM